MSEKPAIETLDIVAALALVGANAAGNPVAFFGSFMAMMYAGSWAGWAFRAGPAEENTFSLTTPGMMLFVTGAVLLAAILVGLKWRLFYRPLHSAQNMRAFAVSQGIFLPGYLIGFVFFRLLFYPTEANVFSLIVTVSALSCWSWCSWVWRSSSCSIGMSVRGDAAGRQPRPWRSAATRGFECSCRSMP